MAEGTIISITKKLGVILLEEYNFLTGVEEQVASLRDELEWISSFLRDATLKRSKYERVDVWVSQVRDLAYSAEDAIDFFILKVMYERDKSCFKLLSRLPFVSYPGPPITVHSLGEEIKSIKARLERISANKSKYALYKLEDGDYLGKDVVFDERRVPDPDVHDDSIVGFNSQSYAVKKKLSLITDPEDLSQLHVVSIVGMGGSGKSTLATKVYNEVKSEFDTCAWINVSQDFDEEHLLRSINKKKIPGKEDFGKLLVVFDDVWRTEDWDVIRECVLSRIVMDKKKSRVLITSRSLEVGIHANSLADTYQIGKLDKEDSIKLLAKKVFGQESIPLALQNIAENILDKCGHLPLAIVVLGGLLSTKPTTPEVWNKVAQSARWQLVQDSSKCSEVLALSYDNLPIHLKPCFLYFGLFPEDHLIDCESLVQLWIAEGFIQERGEECMEDVADDYIEELIQRSLIQVDRRSFNGSVETCRIHDVLREIAISKGRHDKFLDIVGNKRSTKASHTGSRRLAIHSSTSITDEEIEELEILDSNSSSKTRSIVCFVDFSNDKLQRASFYENLMYLRVLDLRGSKKLKKLPKEIGKLVLLKYLNLRGTPVELLPSSISNLRNLQTLDISLTRIGCVPWSVWELKELRHFYANLEQVIDSSGSSVKGVSHNFLLMVSCNSHTSNAGAAQKPKTRRLDNLLTLSTREDGWICNIEFSSLTNLRKLKITEVNVENHASQLSSSIAKFVFLRELDIEWKGTLEFPSFARHVHLYKMRLSGKIKLAAAKTEEARKTEQQPKWIFPPNVAELGLSLTELCRDGIDALSKLKNLKFLELKQGSFLESCMVFPENGFLNLSRLDLEVLSQLRTVEVKENSLPKLKILNLCYLENLVELPSGLKEVKTLQTLRLFFMPEEFIARVKKNEGIDWKKIQHIPTIGIIGSLFKGAIQFNAASSNWEWAGASA